MTNYMCAYVKVVRGCEELKGEGEILITRGSEGEKKSMCRISCKAKVGKIGKVGWQRWCRLRNRVV